MNEALVAIHKQLPHFVPIMHQSTATPQSQNSYRTHSNEKQWALLFIVHIISSQLYLGTY